MLIFINDNLYFALHLIYYKKYFLLGRKIHAQKAYLSFDLRSVMGKYAEILGHFECNHNLFFQSRSLSPMEHTQCEYLGGITT